MSRLFSAIVSIGLGIAAFKLGMDYVNPQESTRCFGDKACADRVLRGRRGKENPEGMKGVALGCALGSAFFAWRAFSDNKA